MDSDNARSEAPRDQAESSFTPVLRRLFHTNSALLAVVFIDMDGESIDYVSGLDPFEAKVAAAHMHTLLNQVRAARGTASLGQTLALEVVASQREAWIWRVGEEYGLVAVLDTGFDRTQLRDVLTLASEEFRREVGLLAPVWEAFHERLSVRVRASPGWQYAPEGFSVGGSRIAISDVLGRWTEQPLVCFRVRTLDGRELTLVHDEGSEHWTVRE
jgi:hypothetical protein